MPGKDYCGNCDPEVNKIPRVARAKYCAKCFYNAVEANEEFCKNCVELLVSDKKN
jgi:hypothetical protein